VTLGFGDDGSIAANAGCNSMSGPGSIDGDVLVAGPLASTEMACRQAIMAQEQWWGTLLTGSPTLAADGRTVTLTSGDDVVTLQEQQPTPAASLTGTDWHLTSTLSMVGRNDGSVSSVPQGVDATLLFGEDGRVNGSTGCNSISGGYTVEGDRISFRNLATTLMACEGAGGEVEHSVLPVLAGSVTYAIDGNRLTLVKADVDAGLEYTAASGA
jgi:heat shock protein HslJ